MSRKSKRIQDNSIDNSDDGEYLGMVDEESFEGVEDKSLVSQSFMDATEEDNNTYTFAGSGGLQYKLVQMTSAVHNPHSITAYSPSNGTSEPEYYVIDNPAEVFSTNTPMLKSKPVKKDTMPTKANVTKKRDDKRRATHNEVERRRRDKINSWITKLAALVPNSGTPDSASKGGILAKACDYITDLTEKQKKLEKLETDKEKLVVEVLKLNQELAELRKENALMRNQLGDIKPTVTSYRVKPENS